MREIFLVAALVCAPCGVASATETSDWVKCDGYPRPEGAGVTAARVVAVISTAGLFGLPERVRYEPAAHGQEGVDACTRALETHLADNFWARRVTMLQARARHNAEAQHVDEALADLRLAAELAQGQAPGPWYERSLGVSSKLLEAAILARRGEQQRAEELAMQAANARQYSATVQMLSAFVFAVSPASTAEERQILDRVARLNPAYGELRASMLAWSEDREVAADEYERLLAAERAANAGVEPVGLVARAALAAYGARRPDRARELTAQLRTAIAAPLATAPGPGDQQASRAAVVAQASQRADAARLMALIEAYEMTQAGDRVGAFAFLTARPLPIEAATLDLLTDISEDPSLQRQREAIRGAIDSMRNQERERRMNAIEIARFAESLPPLEQFEGGNRFRGRSWGANGYRDRASADGAGRVISFSGGTTITTTEELALLRAAQLAIDDGATGFVVRSKSDYQRYYVTSYAGVETSRAPTGFQIEIDVVNADVQNPPAEYAGRVVDANAIWAELGPIFNPPRGRR